MASRMIELISDNDRNLEYIPAVISNIIIGADVFPASITDSTTPLNFMPLQSAIIKLAIAPIPAASVAVKIPPQIPPNTKKISAMIFEPIISCGGQIEMPDNFIKMCKKVLEKHNILMIADEVQTGFGRVGEKYWGFELHNVIPDIVTLGKPMGNGHPIGAVVCTDEISKKFDNGLEFFSSFGGNPVSCRIANEVINEIDRQKLQTNALKTGLFLKDGLKNLSKKYPIIGNIRGKGLFIGVELVDKDLNPETEKTNYLVNRMKELGVLMSNDGLDKNVIKIKPPLIFSVEDSKKLLILLEKVFKENFMKSI